VAERADGSELVSALKFTVAQGKYREFRAVRAYLPNLEEKFDKGHSITRSTSLAMTSGKFFARCAKITAAAGYLLE
jgi:hypothetical protein